MLEARAIPRRRYLNVFCVTAALTALLVGAGSLQATVLILWVPINQATEAIPATTIPTTTTPTTVPATPQTPLPTEDASLPVNQLDRTLDSDGAPLSQDTFEAQSPIAEFDGPPMPPHDLLDDARVVEAESHEAETCPDDEYLLFLEALDIAACEDSCAAAIQEQTDTSSADEVDFDAEAVIEEPVAEQTEEGPYDEDLYGDDLYGESYEENAEYSYEDPAPAYADQFDTEVDVEAIDNNVADEAPVAIDDESEYEGYGYDEGYEDEYDYEGNYQDEYGYEDDYREQGYSEEYTEDDSVAEEAPVAIDDESEYEGYGYDEGYEDEYDYEGSYQDEYGYEDDYREQGYSEEYTEDDSKDYSDLDQITADEDDSYDQPSDVESTDEAEYGYEDKDDELGDDDSYGYGDEYSEEDYSDEYDYSEDEVPVQDSASDVVAEGDADSIHAMTLAAPVLLRTASTLDSVSQWLSSVSARITKIATPGDAQAAANKDELLR